jgi:hypothetical protein
MLLYDACINLIGFSFICAHSLPFSLVAAHIGDGVIQQPGRRRNPLQNAFNHTAPL